MVLSAAAGLIWEILCSEMSISYVLGSPWGGEEDAEGNMMFASFMARRSTASGRSLPLMLQILEPATQRPRPGEGLGIDGSWLWWWGEDEAVSIIEYLILNYDSFTSHFGHMR